MRRRLADRFRPDLAAPRDCDERDGASPLDARGWLGPVWFGWTQALLATPAVLWCGWPFFVRGWNSLVTRKLNMFTLVASGTGAAWLASTVALLFPDPCSPRRSSSTARRRCTSKPPRSS